MQRYDTYKDSGVKWLGEIPGHWEIKRLRAGLTERREKWNSSETLIILSLLKDKGIIPYNEKGEVGNKSKEDHSQYKIARKGDLVINSMNVIIGSLGITQYDGYISPAYYSFKPREGVNLPYFNYILSLRGVQQSIRCYSKGIMEIRLKITSNDFLSMPFPFPSLEEQNAIVTYLDAIINNIDIAIIQQQKMIDLLSERKQIIINNAVTHGLNPNVKMKDSGVEWIGEIPERWTFVRLKHLTKIISKGTTPSTIGKEILSTGNIRFLKAENVVNNTVCETPEFFIDEDTHAILKRSNLQENDLLFVIAGATIGKVAILPKELTPANTNQAISFIRLNNLEMAKYIWYVLQSEITKKYIWLNAVQSAQPNISMEDLGNIKIPIPDIYEQKEIITFIEVKIAPIEKAIINCQKKISLLQERKQIIINEVVTGKVKVSN